MLGGTGRIAFDSDREDFSRDIYTIRVDGSELTRLTTHTGIDNEPAFSPEGNRISFTSDRTGRPQIHIIDLSTMQITQLTEGADGADQSSFSHDGTLVAFHSGSSVWVVPADGTGGVTRVATGLDTFNAYFWPAFSADDSELLFDRNNEIDAVHLDGSGFRRIVQNWTTTIKAPAVSPNGIDVAYHVYCDSGTSVWTTPFSTTTNPCEGRRVTPVGEPNAQRAAWGPNNLIAYTRIDRATNVGSIAVVSRAQGSVPCLLAPAGADDRNPAWSFAP
jgi:Tol biopolymer transport system component